MKYAFMLDHEQEFRLRSMCRVFGLHPSGYYAWRSAPMSPRAKDDARVLVLHDNPRFQAMIADAEARLA